MPVGWLDDAVVDGQAGDALSGQETLRAWQQLSENARALVDSLHQYQRTQGRTHRQLMVEVVGKLVDTIRQNHQTFSEVFAEAMAPDEGSQTA